MKCNVVVVRYKVYEHKTQEDCDDIWRFDQRKVGGYADSRCCGVGNSNAPP